MTLTAVAVAIGTVHVGAGAAQASNLGPGTGPSRQPSLAATSTTTIGADALCERARDIDDSAGLCATSTTLSISAATAVDVSQLSQADLSLISANGVTLRQAAAASYTRTRSQEARGLYYVNWMEKHTGRFYDNGSQVWSTTATLGYTGNHICDQRNGILHDIEVTICSTEKMGSAVINEWDYSQVHVIWEGIPLYASHNMHAELTSSGGVS